MHYKKVFSDKDFPWIQCCNNQQRLYFRIKIILRHIDCTEWFWDKISMGQGRGKFVFVPENKMAVASEETKKACGVFRMLKPTAEW